MQKKTLFLLILFLLALPAKAAGQSVIINEVAWMGSPVENVDSRQHWRYEFVELLNVTDSPISLNGWTLELRRDDLDFSIALWGQVAAGDYFLIGASDKISGVDINYSNLSGKFVNSGQRLVLKDAAGVIVEEVDGRSEWFGVGDNESKLTMERRFPDRDANEVENWGSSMTTGGTPSAENSIFGKEAVLNLDTQAVSSNINKQTSSWHSFFDIVTNRVLLLALALAVASTVALLWLRRYLIREESLTE